MGGDRRAMLICRWVGGIGTRPSTHACNVFLETVLIFHYCFFTTAMFFLEIVPPLTTAESTPFSSSEIKESSAENDVSDENKGSRFDLNVVSPEMEESLSGFIVNPENGCDRVEKEKPYENIGKTVRSLSLLIEAARLIFGEFEDDNKSEFKVKKDEMAGDEVNEKGLKRRSSSSSFAAEEMGEVFKFPEPSSPVVRSKRRRTPVLPNRYKDSVVKKPVIHHSIHAPACERST